MRLILGLVIVLSAAGGGRPAVTVPPTIDMEWHRFRWAELTIGRQVATRAAVLVETSDRALLVNRTGPADSLGPVQMELDAGFSATGRFGIPLRTMEPLPTDPSAADRIFRARVGRLGNRDDSTGADGTYQLGTVGLLYFGSRGLVIDQVGQRIGAPRTGQTLPAALTDRMEWGAIEDQQGRIALPLVWQGDRLGMLWYDPGSSLAPLIVTPEVWRQLTGRTGNEPTNRRLAFPATGDSLVLVGAQASAPVRFGAVSLGPIMVYHVVRGPAGVIAPEVVGVVGNQAFEPFRLLYFNMRTRRFGAVR